MSVNDLIHDFGQAHHDQPESKCPQCGERHTCNGGVTTADAPKGGDVSLCAYCGVILQFNDDLSTKVCPQSELDEMAKESPREYNQLMFLKRKIEVEANRRRRRKFKRN